MKRYETVFIVDADISEDDRNGLLGKVKELIAQNGGEILIIDEWGVQKLAYDIKKKTRGYYVRLDYCGEGPIVAELERSFRIDDRVLKYLTIVLHKNVDLEKLKESLAKSEIVPAPVEPPVSDETAAVSVPPISADTEDTPREEQDAEASDVTNDDTNQDEEREE